MKYEHSSGADFGSVAFVKYVGSFDAKGSRVTNQQELEAAIRDRYEIEGLLLIDIPVNSKEM